MSPPSPYRGRAPQVEDEEGTCSVFLIITPLVLLLNFNRPRSQPSYHSLLLAPKFSLNKPTVLVSFICSLLQCGSVVLVQLLAPSSASHSGLNHRSVARVREEATGPIVLRTASIARAVGKKQIRRRSVGTHNNVRPARPAIIWKAPRALSKAGWKCSAALPPFEAIEHVSTSNLVTPIQNSA
jgi:hypothetical protein